MSVTVYRLAKLRYRDQIFSGLGGLYAHGRWTFRGRPVVYTSGSIALAVLEYTVNYRRRGWIPESVLGRAAIPDDAAIETVRPADLPDDWLHPTPPPALQEIGESWLQRATTAILKVPSAAVPEECNYLLNPRHADFARLVVAEPEPFRFDRAAGAYPQARPESLITGRLIIREFHIVREWRARQDSNLQPSA